MTDVLIVGSGFAGMAAALAAAEKGVKVKVIEKMAFLGGNSSLSGGMMAVPGSSVQKAQGIEDSPEKLIADMTRIGQGLGNPELIRFVEALQKPSLILRSESFCLLHRINFCANDCSGYF